MYFGKPRPSLRGVFCREEKFVVDNHSSLQHIRLSS